MKRKIVKNRFKELLAVKERREGREYTVNELAAILNVNRTSINAYMANRVNRFDAHVLVAMCEFLNCSLDELLIFEDESSPENKTALLTPA